MATKLAKVIPLVLLLVWVTNVSLFPLDTPESDSENSGEDTSRPGPANLEDASLPSQTLEPFPVPTHPEPTLVLPIRDGATEAGGGEPEQGVHQEGETATVSDDDDEDNDKGDGEASVLPTVSDVDDSAGEADSNVEDKVDDLNATTDEEGEPDQVKSEEVAPEGEAQLELDASEEAAVSLDKDGADTNEEGALGKMESTRGSFPVTTSPSSVGSQDAGPDSKIGGVLPPEPVALTLSDPGTSEDGDGPDSEEDPTEMPAVEGRIGRVVEKGDALLDDTELLKDDSAAAVESQEDTEEEEGEEKNEDEEEEEETNAEKEEDVADKETGEAAVGGGESVVENKTLSENNKDDEEGDGKESGEDIGGNSEEALSVQTRADDLGETGGDKQGDSAPGTEGDSGDKDSGGALEEGKVGAATEVDLSGEENDSDEGEDGDEDLDSEVDEDEEKKAGIAKVMDLDEAEKQWSEEHPEEDEDEGSGSIHDELTNPESKEPHSGDGHHSDDTGHDHGEGHDKGHGEGHEGEHVKHHSDTPEDKESKKRTAIIVGVAVGAVALFTLAFFTSRQCKQKAAFTPLQKTKGQGEPETIEFRPVGQAGTPLYEEEAKNGLYRHGPRMGPPSPRFHRKAEGKFKFPDSYTDGGGKLSPSASPAIVPLLGDSPAENGKQDKPSLKLSISPGGGAMSEDTPTPTSAADTPSPAVGAAPQADGLYRHGPRMGPPSPRMHRKTEGKFAFPASSTASSPSPGAAGGGELAEPLMNGVDKLKFIDESAEEEKGASDADKLLPSKSHDPKLTDLVEETTPASPPVNQQAPPTNPSADHSDSSAPNGSVST